MALYYCAGTCGRMISVSVIPGGNPTALAEPDKFATRHVQCAQCKKRWCDRCQPATCSCGAAL